MHGSFIIPSGPSANDFSAKGHLSVTDLALSDFISLSARSVLTIKSPYSFFFSIRRSSTRSFTSHPSHKESSSPLTGVKNLKTMFLTFGFPFHSSRDAEISVQFSRVMQQAIVILSPSLRSIVCLMVSYSPGVLRIRSCSRLSPSTEMYQLTSFQSGNAIEPLVVTVLYLK